MPKAALVVVVVEVVVVVLGGGMGRDSVSQPEGLGVAHGSSV